LNAYRQQSPDYPSLITEIAFFRCAAVLVYLYRVIGALVIAHLTTGAFAVVQQDNAVLISVEGLLFACLYAWSSGAVITQAGEKKLANVRIAA